MVWSAPAGSLADSRASTTQWRAETAPGKVVLTVTAEDGRGGKATDTVTIEVAPLRVLADVLFGFDQSSTATRGAEDHLTTALKTLNDAPEFGFRSKATPARKALRHTTRR